MIETTVAAVSSGPMNLLSGESAEAYALASDLVALEKVWRAMSEAELRLRDAVKAYDAARDSYAVTERAYDEARAKLSSRGLVDESDSVEFMWKAVLRMREIRGVDAPILVPTAGLRAAVVDILRMEMQAFDAALAQANETNP